MGVEDAKHHGDAALAGQRRQVGRAAAQFRDDAGHSGQHAGQRRAGHLRDQDIARIDARQLAFAVDDACAARAPADAGRVAAQAGVLFPDLVRGDGGLDMQRAGLEQLDSFAVEAPFDFRGTLDHFFGGAEMAAQFPNLFGAQAGFLRFAP